MNETSNTFKYRVATINDWAAVLAVLKGAAPEIPLSLDTDESQAKVKTEVVQCCRDGHTWVAIDATDAIVGFVLARPGGNGAITLPFIGVSASSRKQGIFSNLIEKTEGQTHFVGCQRSSRQSIRHGGSSYKTRFLYPLALKAAQPSISGLLILALDGTPFRRLRQAHP